MAVSAHDRYLALIRDESRGPVAQLGRALLRLLAGLFAGLVWLRRHCYRLGLLRTHAVAPRVISVGNLVAGGTGKTPVTILLVRALRAAGFSVGVVMRGYGGKRTAGPAVLSDGKHVLLTPREAGDEPYMLIRELPGVPVVVDSDKTRAAHRLATQFTPAVIVVDDGFQHLRLERNADIVLLDAARPFDNEHLLPRGLLRESPAALARAQVVVITRAQAVPDVEPLRARLRALAPQAMLFTADLVPQCLKNFRTGEEQPLAQLAGKRVVMLSGIARPDSFEAMVQAASPVFAIPYRWPDHHAYSAADMAVLRRLCIENRLDLVVTTAKDAVKLSDVLDVPVPVCVLTVACLLREDGFIDAVRRAAGLS